MYAIISTGNKQYRVEKGDHIAVDRLPNKEIGDQVNLQVLFLGDGDKYTVGKDLGSASVVAQVTGERKGKKVISFDYRNKHRRRTTHGARQIETHLEIKDIVLSR